LLDKGFRVFGSVRKQADAERLKAEFGANFTALMFDIADEAAVLRVRAKCGPRSMASGFPVSSTMPGSRCRVPRRTSASRLGPR
jgi:hypothetical protein